MITPFLLAIVLKLGTVAPCKTFWGWFRPLIILPITLKEEEIKEISEYSNRKEEVFIDLNEEKIVYGNNEIKFKIDPFKKKCLLEGLDDIALSLNKSEKIENFEKDLKVKKPWIFND